MTTYTSVHVPEPLNSRIHVACDRFASVSKVELLRRAWRSYEKGNVDPTLSTFPAKYATRKVGKKTLPGTSQKHDLGKDVNPRLLVHVLDVYLTQKGI